MAIEVLLVERALTTFDLPVPSLERKGYHVALAHTRRQAISCSRSLQPDILIVDVASFGAGGYDELDDVRSRSNGVPSIILPEVGDAIPAQPCLLRTVRGVGYRFAFVEPAPQATGTSANRQVESGETRRKPSRAEGAAVDAAGRGVVHDPGRTWRSSRLGWQTLLGLGTGLTKGPIVADDRH